ncbi:hypothetical protein M3Y97_00214800 [Aphelenchoides bicaudatus]|nr:hypothetical protein M3Y97_00214800 [Aphelenchoides bicaudatus]
MLYRSSGLFQPFLLTVFGFCIGSVLAAGRHKTKPETILPEWREDRYIDCAFCLDYDDFRRLNIFGCRLKQTPSCIGNVCYMRQHKNQAYFLFTSGCLNLTQNQYQVLQYLTGKASPDRESTNANQLCEVSTINTCLCSNKNRCNNVSLHDPFYEYVVPIFRDVDFDEVSHFKYFLPKDPILETVAGSHREREEYYLIRSVSSYTNYAETHCLHCITCIILTLICLLLIV